MELFFVLALYLSAFPLFVGAMDCMDAFCPSDSSREIF